MASDDRFYLLEFRNRPVRYGDIGSLLKISGLVVSGGGASAVLLLLPGEKSVPSIPLMECARRVLGDIDYESGCCALNSMVAAALPLETLQDFKEALRTARDQIIELTDEEWSDFIHRSDQPEVLVGPAKIFQRKVRYEISGAIQQKVWAADGFECRYCGAGMGGRLLTIDHFIPLEMGGQNNATNYLTACKPCNKDKGSEHPREWLDRRGLDFEVFAQYLENRIL